MHVHPDAQAGEGAACMGAEAPATHWRFGAGRPSVMARLLLLTQEDLDVDASSHAAAGAVSHSSSRSSSSSSSSKSSAMHRAATVAVSRSQLRSAARRDKVNAGTGCGTAAGRTRVAAAALTPCHTWRCSTAARRSRRLLVQTLFFATTTAKTWSMVSLAPRIAGPGHGRASSGCGLRREADDEDGSMVVVCWRGGQWKCESGRWGSFRQQQPSLEKRTKEDAVVVLFL
jgi:hypothetical protein